MDYKKNSFRIYSVLSMFYVFTLTANVQGNDSLSQEEIDLFSDSHDSISSTNSHRGPIADAQSTIEQPVTKVTPVDSNEELQTRYPSKENTVFAGQPWLQNSYRLSFFADYFYGTSGPSNLYYASSVRIINTVEKYQTKALHNEWSSGFRVGAEYTFPSKDWDTDLQWFSFRNRASDSVTGDRFIPTYPCRQTSGGSYGTKSQGFWKLTLDQLDLTFGKTFFITKHYSVRPNMGMRALWLDEKYKIIGTNATQLITTFIKNDFSGFGFKLGLDNSFHFGYGVFVDALADIALVYGHNKEQYSSIANYLTSITTGSTVKQDCMREIIPIVDLGIYFKWEKAFRKETLGISLRAGYEYHALINAFTLVQVVSNHVDFTSDSITDQAQNVYVQGLVLGASFSF